MTRHPLEPTRTLLLALASLFPLGHNAAVAQEVTYRLRFEEDAPRLLHVEADLPTTQNLTIGGGHPEPERERWGDYVDGLEITSEDGTPIRWSKSGDNAWSLSGPIPERIRVRYRVRLDHDQVRRGALRMWPPGVDEATYVSGGAVFFRTYAVLMAGAFRSFSSARLFLDLPAGWNVTTNLSPVDGRSNERFTDDLFQFFGAGLMLGTHQTAEVVVDQVNLTSVSRTICPAPSMR